MSKVEHISYPIVQVIWIDAESSDMWEDIEDIKRSCKPIRTVGYLIEDEEEHISVAMQLDLENKNCSMVMTIPNFWIESIEELSIG